MVLRDSTFALILAPSRDFVSTTVVQARFYEALRAGAIPVVVGGDQVKILNIKEFFKKNEDFSPWD